jgi:hypothetical protein
MVVDSRDCLWRSEPAPPRLGGGYLFAARPVSGGVRIAFLPAYFRDCGWTRTVCAIRGRDCGAHAGDSELIVVDVEPSANPGRWQTTAVFLSAHCFGRADGRCRWYRGDDLRSFAWVDGTPMSAPRVWVSRGKHAHYPSARACDTGHWFYDTCDENRTVMRFPVISATQNVGSRDRPRPGARGCLSTAELPLGADGAVAGARECLWDPAQPFGGWQSDGSGSRTTPYALYLMRIAGF